LHPFHLQNDLRSISAAVHKMCCEDLKIHRLLVSESLALQMFEDNPYKSQQIPDIASKSPSGKTVTLYRVGKLYFFFAMFILNLLKCITC
jgi:large subunit ribosomal protein L39